jgi:hypothetical protein
MRASITFAMTVVLASAAPAYSQSLDLQEKCSTQARKAFIEYEREDKAQSRGASKLISIDYQSHYNTKIKKCLLLLETLHALGNELSTSVTLTDAYERRTYASYLWISRENKKYWDVPPSECELIPTLREKRTCATREEFDAFVAEYMEE